MKAVLQRVTRASVTVDGAITGEIGRGLLVLLGVQQGDTETDVHALAEKTIALRIFDDPDGKNEPLGGGRERRGAGRQPVHALGDCRKGRRPSFVDAAPPGVGRATVRNLRGRDRRAREPVATGKFRAHMEVELVNDGPVTLILDSRKG